MANVSSSNGLEKRPKLRFPGFDEPWKSKPFSSLYKYVNEKNDGSFSVDSIISVANMYFKPDARITDMEYLKTYNIFKLGDIAFEGNKSKDFSFGRFVENTIGDGIVSHVFVVFRPINNFHNFDYWKYAINNENVMGRILARCTKKTTMMTNLVTTDFLTQKIYCPSLEEQAHIASFLSLIDQRIRKQKELLNALKKYKRGVIQHIFRRSHGQTESQQWQQVSLGDIFKKVSRRNTDGKIKNVITNSAEYGLIPQRDFFDKDIAVEGNTENYYVIENEDFVYNPRKSNTAPYGPFNRYTLREQGIISPLYTCLVLKVDINSSYLAWYFKSGEWHRYIYDNGSQGVRHDRVSMTDDLLMGIPVIFPDRKTQDSIANALDLIESRLNLAQNKLDLLTKEQNGFMQQLFI